MAKKESHPVVVSIEGLDIGTGIIIAPGALHLEREEVPVTWNNVGGLQIGKARNMRRDGYNVLMDVELEDGIFLNMDDNIVGSVFAQPFKAHEEKNVNHIIQQIIDSGEIRGVQLTEKENAPVRQCPNCHYWHRPFERCVPKGL